MRRAAVGLAIVAASACTFDSGGQGTGSSESTGMDATTTTTAPETTSTTTLPSDTTTSSAETSSGEEEAATSSGTTASAESTDTGPSKMEMCNGRDDDDDGAVDEYSPMNESCEDCDYQVTESGFVQSLCTDPLPWLEAQERCESLGARLATADSEQHNAEIFGSTTGMEAWIGLTDAEVEGNWVWADGTPVRFAAWGNMQPNNQGNEDCGHMQPDNPTWNDDECTNAWPYVCRTLE